MEIDLVASFNRMRRFKSLDAIKQALEDSSLMEMNEDKTKMRRKKAMVVVNDPRVVDKAIERSVYAVITPSLSPFPLLSVFSPKIYFVMNLMLIIFGGDL